LQFPDPNS